MKRFIILTIIITALSSNLWTQTNTVAVYVSGKDDAINKMVGDKLVDAFVKDGKYVAVERTDAFLSELKKEQKYQMSGEVSDNEISKIGKQFGVQYICVVNIYDSYKTKKIKTENKIYYTSEMQQEQHISARLISVESVEIINSANTDACLQYNRDVLEDACKKLAKQLTQKPPKQIAEEQAAKDATKKALEEALEEANKAKEKARLDSIRTKYAPEDNDIKKQLDKGYFIVEDMCVTIASDFTEFSKKEAKSEATKSRFKISSWRLPTAIEFKKIANYITKHRDNEKYPQSYYYFNSFYDKYGYSKLYEDYWWIDKHINSGSRYKYLMLVSDINK